MLHDSDMDVAVKESMTTTGWPGTAGGIIRRARLRAKTAYQFALDHTVG